jgi:hypothetical protein
MPATTIDTGTGVQANTVIATAQSQIGTTVPNSNWCANFVSDVFKQAGFASAFSATGYVPTLVTEFAGKTSTDINSAQPGDLIVFGKNEHVMMYEGSGQVIGTLTSGTRTTVQETSINNVITDSGAKGPSLVLHTNLDGSAPASFQTINANFGTYFKGLASLPQSGYTSDYIITNQDVNNWAEGMLETYSSPYNAGGGSYVGGQGWTEASGKLFKAAAIASAMSYVGKPVSALPDQIAITNAPGYSGTGPAPDLAVSLDPLATLGNAATNIAGLLGKFTNPANWLHFGAMVIGVGLIGFGMWTVVGDLRETGPQGLVSPMPIILKEGA